MKTVKPRKNPLVMFIHKLGSPPWFYDFTGQIRTLVVGCICWFDRLGTVPRACSSRHPDYLQGESYRIMYIHVPAAWMSMLIYVLMACMGFIALIWRIRTMEIMAMNSAPYRRRLHPDRAGHRFTVGPPDLGRLLGLGCTADQ